MSVDICLRNPSWQPIMRECPHCGGSGEIVDGDKSEHGIEWIGGITHNLYEMANAAGIKGLWNPEAEGWKTAAEAVPHLDAAVKTMKERPELFDKFNAENGWGIREDLIDFVERVIVAFKEHPDWIPEADR